MTNRFKDLDEFRHGGTVKKRPVSSRTGLARSDTISEKALKHKNEHRSSNTGVRDNHPHPKPPNPRGLKHGGTVHEKKNRTLANTGLKNKKGELIKGRVKKQNKRGGIQLDPNG